MAAIKVDVPSLHIRLKAATPAEFRGAHNVELSIPRTAGRNALRKLLYHLLTLPESSQPDFEFLADGEQLRTTLDKFLQRRSLSAEGTIDVTYYIPIAEPRSETPIQASNEWLSSVCVLPGDSNGKGEAFALVGSYSGMPAAYRGELPIVEEAKCLGVKHAAPIKAVAWLRDGHHFITASQDQSVRLWAVSDGDASATPVATFRTEDSGDPISLGAAAVSAVGTERAALGADDGSVWVLPDLSADGPRGAQDGVKRKTSDSATLSAVRIGGAASPLPVSGVQWRGDDVVSAGWDAMLRVWNVEACVASLNIPCGGKPVMDVDVAEHVLMVAAVDGAVRICDARDGRGVVAACGIKGSHDGVVSGVRWLESGRNGVSCGLDGTVRFWDTRAMLSPARIVENVHDGERCLAVDALRRQEAGAWQVFSAGADGKLARIAL